MLSRILAASRLRAEWTIGPGTLTSVSAWRFWNWGPSNDRDFTGLPITTVSANPSSQNQYSQEIRYAGTSGRLDYVVGTFAYHQRQHTTGAQEQGTAASRWLLNPGNVPFGSSACIPATANACNPAMLNGLRSENDIVLRSTSLAAYSQVVWHVTDRLRLQPGVRINYDKKDGSYVAVVTTGTGSTMLNNDQRGILAPQSYQPQFSDWNFSYDFTASYDLAPHVLAYATYARAFKSGGINLSGLPLDAANNPILSAATVRPETVNHYRAWPEEPVVQPAADLQSCRLLDRHLRLSGDRHQRPARRAARLSRQRGPGAACAASSSKSPADRPTASTSTSTAPSPTRATSASSTRHARPS